MARPKKEGKAVSLLVIGLKAFPLVNLRIIAFSLVNRKIISYYKGLLKLAYRKLHSGQ